MRKRRSPRNSARYSKEILFVIFVPITLLALMEFGLRFAPGFFWSGHPEGHFRYLGPSDKYGFPGHAVEFVNGAILTTSKSYFVEDKEMGRVNAKGAVIRAVYEYKGQLIYDQIYRTDQWGRRVIGDSKRKKPKHYVLLMGCSFAFGEGLSAESSLGGQIQRMLPEAKVYVSAVGGYGPNHWLRLARSGEAFDGITESEGIAIYIHPDFHLDRVLGKMSQTHGWQGRAPRFALNSRSELTDLGTFESSQPILTYIYSWLRESKLLGRLGIDFPIGYRKDDFQLAGAVMNDLAKWSQKNGARRFYLVSFPKSTHSQKMFPYLNPSVQVLDHSALDLTNLTGGDDEISKEGHPTAKSIEIIAGKIVEALEKDEFRD